MRLSLTSACCVLVLLAALGAALPVAQPSNEAILIELVPEQETLHTLDLGEPKTDVSSRDKRTIGFLRETFPTLSELIDRKLQTITRFLFRVIGRLVLGGGGGDSTGNSDSGTSSTGTSASSSSSGSQGRRISITLPTYPPSLDDEEEDEDEEDSSPASSTNDVLSSAASDKKPETVAAPNRPESNDRVKRATDDQKPAASETSAPAIDQDSAAAEENRDKRFLFGFGGGDSGSGSAGGSGNFLFDIIRLIAGSGTTEETSESSHGATATGGTSGAVGYSAGAEAIVTPELDVKPDDGYTSGIPGPITRLFVIANRGVSNLIQDLILRLAQTSERIVNFKARLITSII